MVVGGVQGGGGVVWDAPFPPPPSGAEFVKGALGAGLCLKGRGGHRGRPRAVAERSQRM